MEKQESIAPPLKYKKWIILLSIVIPVAVAILFGIRIPNVAPLNFLPPIYASINGITAVLLIFALVSIKQKNIKVFLLQMNTNI